MVCVCVCVQVLLVSTKFVPTNIVKNDLKCVCVWDISLLLLDRTTLLLFFQEICHTSFLANMNWETIMP